MTASIHIDDNQKKPLHTTSLRNCSLKCHAIVRNNLFCQTTLMFESVSTKIGSLTSYQNWVKIHSILSETVLKTIENRDITAHRYSLFWYKSKCSSLFNFSKPSCKVKKTCYYFFKVQYLQKEQTLQIQMTEWMSVNSIIQNESVWGVDSLADKSG